MRRLLGPLFVLVEIIGVGVFFFTEQVVLAIVLMAVGSVGYLFCRDDLNT